MVTRFALQKRSNPGSYSHLFSQGDTDAHTALCNNYWNDISLVQQLKSWGIQPKKKKKTISEDKQCNPGFMHKCVVCEHMWVFAFVSGVSAYLWAWKRNWRAGGERKAKMQRGEGGRWAACEMLFVFKALATFCSSHIQLHLCLILISQREGLQDRHPKEREETERCLRSQST